MFKRLRKKKAAYFVQNWVLIAPEASFPLEQSCFPGPQLRN